MGQRSARVPGFARAIQVPTVIHTARRQPSSYALCRPLETKDIVASEAQIQANRRNARHSTGPKTGTGKQAVRYNALKHGLFAEASLLPGEDTALFRALAEEMQALFEPVGELEQLLVDRITSCAWRLRRLVQVEAGLFVWRFQYAIANKPKVVPTADEELRALQEAIQGPARLVDDQGHPPAVGDGEDANGLRSEALGTLGRAFISDEASANAFSKLARYETTIERALYRALHELQQLQSQRPGNSQDGATTSASASNGPDGVAVPSQAPPALGAADADSASAK